MFTYHTPMETHFIQLQAFATKHKITLNQAIAISSSYQSKVTNDRLEAIEDLLDNLDLENLGNIAEHIESLLTPIGELDRTLGNIDKTIFSLKS